MLLFKKLESNLLLVAESYKYNGVSLKRVNTTYVLPINTKLKLNAEVKKEVDNKYFEYFERDKI